MNRTLQVGQLLFRRFYSSHGKSHNAHHTLLFDYGEFKPADFPAFLVKKCEAFAAIQENQNASPDFKEPTPTVGCATNREKTQEDRHDGLVVDDDIFHLDKENKSVKEDRGVEFCSILNSDLPAETKRFKERNQGEMFPPFSATTWNVSNKALLQSAPFINGNFLLRFQEACYSMQTCSVPITSPGHDDKVMTFITLASPKDIRSAISETSLDRSSGGGIGGGGGGGDAAAAVILSKSCLLKWKKLMRANVADLSTILVMESDKPWVQAYHEICYSWAWINHWVGMNQQESRTNDFREAEKRCYIDPWKYKSHAEDYEYDEMRHDKDVLDLVERERVQSRADDPHLLAFIQKPERINIWDDPFSSIISRCILKHVPLEMNKKDGNSSRDVDVNAKDDDSEKIPMRYPSTEVKTAWDNNKGRIQSSKVAAVFIPAINTVSTFMRQVIPLLVSGNRVVVIVDGLAPLTILSIAKLVVDAEFPNGVLSILPVGVSDTKDALVETLGHPCIQKLFLTTENKDWIQELMTLGTYAEPKAVHCELIGYSPFIVLADADVKEAVNALFEHRFLSSGHYTSQANRIYVHEALLERFVHLLCNKVEKLQYRSSLDFHNQVAHLHKDIVYGLDESVWDALSRGARLELGGHMRYKGHDGCCFEPTILSHVAPDSKVLGKASRGPVAAISSFGNVEQLETRMRSVENEALIRRHSACYIYCGDLEKGKHMARRLAYHMTQINGHEWRPGQGQWIVPWKDGLGGYVENPVFST